MIRVYIVQIGLLLNKESYNNKLPPINPITILLKL